MLWLWFALVILAISAVGGTTLFRRGWRLKRNADMYSMDGEGLMIVGTIVLILPAVLTLIIATTFIDRHVGEQSCSKKDAYSASSYVWVDYHFFNYDCMLITPTGNITETPVLPIEDVGNDR